ncbi:hypothetical protein ATANTOWER_007937 [Ataeniobius toweri]|uniref:Uncharacterized protein n=1 Tax=Ataeniobius toweri TaxID=208326 RepID=A0ABU7CA81_9TELE|nr:hypothetical protein [Ataeniobius toweri]
MSEIGLLGMMNSLRLCCSFPNQQNAIYLSVADHRYPTSSCPITLLNSIHPLLPCHSPISRFLHLLHLLSLVGEFILH